jgi:hypothetical protein
MIFQAHFDWLSAAFLIAFRFAQDERGTLDRAILSMVPG